MKILVLTNLFPNPWDPLRGTFNRQQFERLGRRHDVHVLTAVDFRQRMRRPRHPVDIRNLGTDHFVFVYPPGIGRSLHAVCWLLSLWLQRGRGVRRAGYDCILASWAYPDAAAAVWLARRLRVPCVVKVHGSDLNVQAEYALRRRQIRFALRGAGAVVAVSRALADKAVAIGADPARVQVVYNGVDGGLFSPGSRELARQALGLEREGRLLLYVGNLKASKGCLDLLEAFATFLDSCPGARLIYVGSGPCGAELARRVAGAKWGSQVHLVGAVAHRELADWFRAADVLCLPSHNEGVPNVVLEAMACGTPVVASRVGGIPEVVPQTAGVLVPPHDVGALAAALGEAVARNWNEGDIVAHAARFSWDDNIRELERIVDGAIHGATPGADTTA